MLVAALICDIAVTDPSTGKKNLIGIFDKIVVGKFPTKRSMYLYIKLADAEGTYKIEAKYVDRKSGSEIANAISTVSVPSRMMTMDAYIAFPPLPMLLQGRYEFQIWSDSVFLGSAFLDAEERKI